MCCPYAFLWGGGASAKVSILKSNFGMVSDGATMDKETGNFKWTARWSNAMELFTNLEGQVSKYKHLKIKLTDPTHGYRLLF